MENEDKELEHRYTEFYNNYDLYMMKYILPEVYASQFASYYYRDLINGEDLRIYVGTIGDVFNFSFKFEEIRKDVEDILKIKYNLRITNDTPLTMEIISKGNEKE